MGFCRIVQASLELLTSSDPLTSASQSAGIIGMSHHTQLNMSSAGDKSYPTHSTLQTSCLEKGNFGAPIGLGSCLAPSQQEQNCHSPEPCGPLLGEIHCAQWLSPCMPDFLTATVEDLMADTLELVGNKAYDSHRRCSSIVI